MEGNGKDGREGKRGEKEVGVRGGEGRKGPFPLFLFYESTTSVVQSWGPYRHSAHGP